MDKEKIIDFFNSHAADWDNNQQRNERVIGTILDKSGIFPGASVLDVASGTGILFGDYISRDAGSITGVDISAEMLKLAKEKYPSVKLICADAECYNFEEKYDVIMIYNAFPHFLNPEKLFSNLCNALKRGGRLTVAHGAGKAEIDRCHKGSANSVSRPLPSAEELSYMMSQYLETDIIISDESMYMVSGKKRI